VRIDESVKTICLTEKNNNCEIKIEFGRENDLSNEKEQAQSHRCSTGRIILIRRILEESPRIPEGAIWTEAN